MPVPPATNAKTRQPTAEGHQVAQSSSSGDSDVVVEISDVWKIFGDNAAAALAR
jgi:hypothetical protein